MTSYDPSRDWDTYYDSCERQANEAFMQELQDIACSVLPHIVAARPNLAAQDAAEEAFEYAAALYSARLRLSNGSCRAWPQDKKEPKPWEVDFWHRNSDILP
jgi:hypothetical protein